MFQPNQNHTCHTIPHVVGEGPTPPPPPNPHPSADLPCHLRPCRLSRNRSKGTNVTRTNPQIRPPGHMRLVSNTCNDPGIKVSLTPLMRLSYDKDWADEIPYGEGPRDLSNSLREQSILLVCFQRFPLKCRLTRTCARIFGIGTSWIKIFIFNHPHLLSLPINFEIESSKSNSFAQPLQLTTFLIHGKSLK